MELISESKYRAKPPFFLRAGISCDITTERSRIKIIVFEDRAQRWQPVWSVLSQGMSVTNLQRLDVFISCPGDLDNERKAASRAIERLNKLSYYSDRYLLRALNFNELVPPQVGKIPQDIVNRYQSIEDSYLLICMMWTRMGTALKDEKGEEFPSGTVYEFTQAYRLNQRQHSPQILLYRKTADKPDSDADQKQQVDAFFKKFEGKDAPFKGLYRSFDDTSEFENTIFEHIDKVLAQFPPSPEDNATSVYYVNDPPNVPEEPSELLGRDAIVQNMGELLKAGKSVLLQGLGGLGKTATAAAITRQFVQMVGPALWIRAGKADAAALFNGLARTIGAPGELTSGRHFDEDWLRAKLSKYDIKLIVVDDVWNEEAFARLQKGIPHGIPLLVTSRKHLAVGHLETLDVLTPYDAIALLKLHSGNASLKDSSAASLCEILGYLPFSVEIAGKTLSRQIIGISELLRRIKNAPHDLVAPPEYENDPNRKSVASMIQTSMDMVDKHSKQVFIAFGGFYSPQVTTRLMSEYIKLIDKDIDVASALETLHTQGLVTKEAGGHYRVHDLTFAFARQQFETPSQVETPHHDRKLILQACLNFVRRYTFNLTIIDSERINLLAAARDSRKTSKRKFLIDLMWYLAVGQKAAAPPRKRGKTEPYFDVFGYSTETLDLIQNAIAYTKAAGDQEKACYLLGKLGDFYNKLAGQYEQALPYYEQARGLAEQLGEHCYLATLDSVIATIYAGQGKEAEAEANLSRAELLATQYNCKRVKAKILEHRGNVAGRQNKLDLAKSYYTESLHLANELGEPEARYYAHLGLGNCAQYATEGDLEEALHQFSVAERIARPYPRLRSSAVHSLGEVYHQMSEEEVDATLKRRHKLKAEKYFNDALGLYERNNESGYLNDLRAYMQELGYAVASKSLSKKGS